MKCLLVLALLCAAAYGQMCNGGMRGIHGMRGNHGIGGMRGSGGMSLMSMVGCMCIERLARDQVGAMLAEHPTLTVAECEARCDALFVLDSVPSDEALTDAACANQCQA
ncbi:hypothetical protein C0Q70_03619 [Pomacea canaliculata]|uniref:Uncharacterized protein n=2 Tax=Pomacea canaliculata TaxID=400727 RepID=A0A2T7PT77_POMCA|nr:hypothetical protein C0Q70_03619 [Pomacea canaliculata]